MNVRGTGGVRLACLKAARRLAGLMADRIDDQVFRLSLDQWLRANFRPRSDDLFVAAFPKSGTTWMQMLLYQLTTNGEMNFDHIYKVSPWLAIQFGDAHGGSRTAAATVAGIDALPSPRIFKTHLAYRALPRWLDGRFIFVTRNCLDVAVSMMHHQRSYVDPACTFDEIFDWSFRRRGAHSWFAYTRDWMANRYRRPVLHVRYEDMKQDLEPVVRRIARFCDLTIDERELPRILERSSFAFMKLHQHKFGERPDEPPPPKVFDNFIRKGEPGEGRQYATEEQQALIRESLRRLPYG